MNILEKYAEDIADKEAQEREMQVYYWIAKRGKIKLLFGRWLFVWCDMKHFSWRNKVSPQ